MSSAAAIRAGAAQFLRKHKALEAPINNAAVMQGAADSILDASADELETSLQVNASDNSSTKAGPVRVVRGMSLGGHGW